MVSDPAPPSAPHYSAYSLPSTHLPGEDILFCIDVDLKEVAAVEQAAATNESEAATLRSEVERLEGLLAAEKASHEEEMRRGARLGDQLQTAYQEKAALEE
uniref:Uncharacterized protein n=1 Tax=Zea mays TaxID=4577 RepID=A0A804NSC6_MAIZE